MKRISFDERSSSSNSSKISTKRMNEILDKLKCNTTRESTKRNYFSIWRSFNSFVIRLDRKPPSWEEKVALFIAFLSEKGTQSSTIKSYISAIKCVLKEDGYQWNNQKILLSALTKACRLKKDCVRTRLLIQCGLLELILFEIQRIFTDQTYLSILYKTIFALGYYGLFRVGELTMSDHVIKASNIHIATNKEKILVVLYSSKTLNKGGRPQKVKITSNSSEKSGSYLHRFFCPFRLIRQYITLRETYENENEQFFIFRDKTPVRPCDARSILKDCIKRIGLDHSVYGIHSLRIGRSVNLENFGYSINELKSLGRWSSNAVYKYLRR